MALCVLLWNHPLTLEIVSFSHPKILYYTLYTVPYNCFRLQHSQEGGAQASLESIVDLVKAGPSMAGSTVQAFLSDTFDKVGNDYSAARVCVCVCVFYVCIFSRPGQVFGWLGNHLILGSYIFLREGCDWLLTRKFQRFLCWPTNHRPWEPNRIPLGINLIDFDKAGDYSGGILHVSARVGSHGSTGEKQTCASDRLRADWRSDHVLMIGRLPIRDANYVWINTVYIWVLRTYLVGTKRAVRAVNDLIGSDRGVLP